MGNAQLQYTRAARVRLQVLPAEARMYLETHLENLALLIEATSPERLLQLLSRDEEGFVTAVQGTQVHFVVNARACTLLVYRIEPAPVDGRPAAVEPPTALNGR